MFMNSSALAVVNILLTFVAPQLLDELAFLSRYLVHWQMGASAIIRITCDGVMTCPMLHICGIRLQLDSYIAPTVCLPLPGPLHDTNMTKDRMVDINTVV